MRWFALALAALPAVSLAAAPLHHSGRLLDAVGAPRSGAHTLRFALYGQPEEGTAVWTSASYSVTLADGYFSVELGDAALTDELLAQDLWLETRVGGEALAPRQRLGAVPLARVAGAATSAGTLPQAATAPATCDVAAAGQLYFDTDDLQVYACNGAVWTPVGTSGATPGQAPQGAVASCAAIQLGNPAATSGRYYVDPLGTGPYPVWCEMGLGEGGWELAMNLDTGDGNVRSYRDDAWWTADTDFGSVTAPFGGDFKSGDVFSTPHRELMIVAHKGGTALGWRSWDLAAPLALRTFLAEHQRSRFPAALTGPSTGSSVTALDALDAIVKPGGALFVNQEWGSTVSYDLARIRNGAMSATDNVDWGIGMQMDAQNNGQMPYYPGCDAGSRLGWNGHVCMGTDRACTYDCGAGTGTPRDLAYDYAIYVRDPVAPAVADPSLPGNSASTAVLDCAALEAARPTAPSGRYWITLGGTAFETRCELELADGGWTLVMNLDTSDGNVRFYRDDAWWTGSGSYGTAATALTQDHKSGPAFTRPWSQLLIRAHREDQGTVGWRRWTMAPNTVLQTVFSAARSRTPAAFTTGSPAASVGDLAASEAVVRPAGALYANMEWGSGVSYDLARIRSSAMSGTDNQEWGLGLQMDAQNNGQMPYYPGCDAGGTGAWSGYFCLGTDRQCPHNCGDAGGGTIDLMLDYAIYAR